MTNSIFFKTFSIVFVLATVFSCKVYDPTDGMNISKAEKKLIREKRKREEAEALKQLPLDEYLRVTQNIQVKGNGEDAIIIIRNGATSLIAADDPLFVLDGIQIDTFRELFEQLDVEDIKEVRVLKTASELALYGAKK